MCVMSNTKKKKGQTRIDATDEHKAKRVLDTGQQTCVPERVGKALSLSSSYPLNMLTE